MQTASDNAMVKQEGLPDEGTNPLGQASQTSQSDESGSKTALPMMNDKALETATKNLLLETLTAKPVDGKILVDVNLLQSLMFQHEMMKNQINSLLIQRESLFLAINLYKKKPGQAKPKSSKTEPEKEVKSEDVQNELSQEKSEKSGSERKKRWRRTAKEIPRSHLCPFYEVCQKAYGAEGSLIQHIRIKHPDFDVDSWDRVSKPIASEQSEQ